MKINTENVPQGFIWLDTLSGEIAIRHTTIQSFQSNRIMVGDHWINVYAELDDIAEKIAYCQTNKV